MEAMVIMIMAKVITLAKFSEQVFTKHGQPIHVSCIVEHVPEKILYASVMLILS